MKIINTQNMAANDILDFTTDEPMYWDKRLPRNKIHKMKCPYCGRWAKVDEFFENYDHQALILDNNHFDIFDTCATPLETCQEIQTIRRTTALNLPVDETLFSIDAIRIAKLRGFIQTSV